MAFRLGAREPLVQMPGKMTSWDLSAYSGRVLWDVTYILTISIKKEGACLR